MKALTVLFTAHLLGDFYFQPDKLAKNKNRSFAWLLLHSAIYAAATFASLLLLGGDHVIACAAAAGSHFVIDAVKFFILKALPPKNDPVPRERAFFCADQALHVAAIAAAACLVRDPAIPPYMEGLGRLIGVDAYVFLGHAAMMLAAVKPTNVFVRIMLGVKPGEAKPELRAGRFIGALERILVTVFLILGQYASIAIVFTAKSIARFKQLDDRSFAEYYIFGTLLSAVSAVGVFLFVKYLGAK